MKNLAGIKDADKYILEELCLAGIPFTEGERSQGEVPYSVTGSLKGWTFQRARYYMVASTKTENGLLLSTAEELYNKAYPLRGKDQPKTYGQIIRAGADCVCRPPTTWAKHFDAEGRSLLIDPDGTKEKEYDDYIAKGIIDPNPQLRFVPSLEGVVVRSVIDLYHIDSQLGLNEFACVLRSVNDI